MQHPTFKRLFTLFLVMALCASFLVLPSAASGRTDTPGPTKAEIRAKWKEVTSASTLFVEEPSVSAPYVAGALTDDFLETGITYLNYVRFVANLPAVQLSDELNEEAQHGAVLLAAIDELTHYPSQPADMDDDFYAVGYSATTSSNISARWGYSPYTCLKGAVSGCMADSSSLGNLSTVGHRRWLLNPTLLNVGFGYAEAPSGWSYIVTKVFDRSGASFDYDYISWPASGNFPTNLFDTETPWSITLNPKKYQQPKAASVQITITRESDGKTWSFDSTTGSPQYAALPYMVVENSYYGVNNCIIFHPGSDNIDSYEGIFTVDVSGIYDINGNATTLHYQVDFFDVEAEECEHNYQSVVTAPTCTEQGYTTYTCISCGDSYVGNYVDASGHKYQSAVTAPTCTEQGCTTYTCTNCGDSYTGSYTDPVGHNYQGGTCSNCGASEAAPGDVNMDGEVDIFDANLVVAYYNETMDLTDAQLADADVNGDGEIDIFDANLIVAYYNETIDVFPVEDN